MPNRHRKRRKARRTGPLRRLLQVAAVCAVLTLLLAAAYEPLIDTPLQPLSDAALNIVQCAYDAALDMVHYASDAARNIVQCVSDAADGPGRGGSASARQSSFPLTLLVNRWNPAPDDLYVELRDIGGGKQVDARCVDDLSAMLAACRADGLEPVVCSAYRSHSYQTMLYENKAERLRGEGLSEGDAYAEAMTVVALPGTSEHQLGLALDIVDADYQELDEAQEHTAVQQWLMTNSWRYGFILRYPNGMSAVTGIIYEPWHYRYVGRDVARDVYESGLCLEDYLASR